MGEIKFEGDPPYGLAPAQDATADAVDENVKMTLYVSIPGKRPSPAPIRIQMMEKVAQKLISQLQAAVLKAEKNSRKT